MTTVHEEVNEETQHYIVYGEWKIYDEEGNYHCKTGDIELYKTLEEATESFNKMIEEEKFQNTLFAKEKKTRKRKTT